MADKLTRAEMEQVIGEGGSVLHQGRTITSVAGLPTDAELAKGDPDREAAARAELESRIAEMHEQLAQIHGERPQVESLQQDLADAQEERDRHAQEMEALRAQLEAEQQRRQELEAQLAPAQPPEAGTQPVSPAGDTGDQPPADTGKSSKK